MIRRELQEPLDTDEVRIEVPQAACEPLDGSIGKDIAAAPPPPAGTDRNPPPLSEALRPAVEFDRTEAYLRGPTAFAA